MFEPGDKVRRNGRYIVAIDEQGQIFEVVSEPWPVYGKLVVELKGLPGAYAVDGLEKVEE